MCSKSRVKKSVPLNPSEKVTDTRSNGPGSMVASLQKPISLQQEANQLYDADVSLKFRLNATGTNLFAPVRPTRRCSWRPLDITCLMWHASTEK